MKRSDDWKEGNRIKFRFAKPSGRDIGEIWKFLKPQDVPGLHLLFEFLLDEHPESVALSCVVIYPFWIKPAYRLF